MDEPSAAKRPSVLTIDRAAFLLLRVKRAFKKKRQQRKEKHAAAAAAAAAEALGGARRAPPPLLRSRTLPAIIAPGFSILQAQIDPQRSNDLTQSQMLCRGVSSHKVCGLRAHAPRISFAAKEEELRDQRRKSASSRLGSSPRTSLAGSESGDVALKVPTPRGSVSSTSSSSGSRLARLLTQGVRGTPEDVASDAPRRLSWERRESAGQLPRSASIDSMVEAGIYARHSEPQPLTLHLPARADRALSLVSPAVGRRAKSQRGLAAFVISYFVYTWVEKAHWLSLRKDPSIYAAEVMVPKIVCKRVYERPKVLDDIGCPPDEEPAVEKDPCAKDEKKK